MARVRRAVKYTIMATDARGVPSLMLSTDDRAQVRALAAAKLAAARLDGLRPRTIERGAQWLTAEGSIRVYTWSSKR